MENKYLFVKKEMDKDFIKVYTVTYKTNGENREYYFVSRNDEEDLAILNENYKPTAIEAFTYMGDEIIMIDEFRSALNKRVLSFCAGLIEPNEDYEKAFKREIFEELGGTIKSIKLCQNGPMPVCAGLSDEANVFAIVELDKLGKQHLEKTEDIKVVSFKVNELEKKIQNNELPLTASGYFGAMLLINELKNKKGE